MISKNPPLAEPPKRHTRSGIQVISRAAAILRALENEPSGLSLGQIATKVGLARSTVQRIVSALADERFVIAATPKSRVKLGPALIRMANAARLDTNDLVRPIMEKLSRDLDETIDLSVIQGESAVFVDQISGNQRLRAVSAIGEKFPLHASACGKSLLATLPDEKLDQILVLSLARFTENTITSPAQLRRELHSIRETRISHDMEEHTEGICAIGTSFFDPLGKAYAITIPAPTARFNRNRARFKDALLNCREAIFAVFGQERSSKIETQSLNPATEHY